MLNKLTSRKLTAAQIQDIVNSKKDWIYSCCSPSSLYLVGSAATGEMTTASDVDLVLVLPTKQACDEAKRKLFVTRPPNDWPMDLLVYSEKDFEEQALSGGGMAWLAHQEGIKLSPNEEKETK